MKKKTRKLSRSEVIKPKIPPRNPYIVLQQEQYKERELQRLIKKRERNPERLRARKMVEIAVRNGEISPRPCEKNYSGCQHWPTQAHHESYEAGRELDVVWVCINCHNAISAKAWRKAWEHRHNLSEKIEKSEAMVVLNVDKKI